MAPSSRPPAGQANNLAGRCQALAFWMELLARRGVINGEMRRGARGGCITREGRTAPGSAVLVTPGHRPLPLPCATANRQARLPILGSPGLVVPVAGSI